MAFRPLRRVQRKLAARMRPETYCKIINFRNAMLGKRHRIEVTDGGGHFLARDDTSQIHFARRSRHNRYKEGVDAGIAKLAAEYRLDLVKDLDGGVFIDCGANVGEMGLWAAAKGMEYIAFEPEELEARCCDLNNFDGNRSTHRLALWNTETTLTFFQKAETADGSVIEMSKSDSQIKIEARPLDTVVDLSEASGPVILKVEAEGAEPEVLEGAKGTLARVDWVAVDCGFERGIEKRHTLVETANFLQGLGFEMVAAELKRLTVLYRRRT